MECLANYAECVIKRHIMLVADANMKLIAERHVRRKTHSDMLMIVLSIRCYVKIWCLTARHVSYMIAMRDVMTVIIVGIDQEDLDVLNVSLDIIVRLNADSVN